MNAIPRDLKLGMAAGIGLFLGFIALQNGGVVVANEPELRVDYRARVDDPSLYPNQFIMALSHLLSAELAVPIIGAEQGRQIRADSLSVYESYIASAIAANSNEQYQPPDQSEFITVRR